MPPPWDETPAPPSVRPAPPTPATKPALNTFRTADQQIKKVSAIRSGSTVSHPKYGKGTVVSKEGDGEDAKLIVSFAGHGIKKLIEKFAGIKQLD